jgi:UDP-N-acetylglucosamine acyltransferase
MAIDPSARIHPTAIVEDGAEVGPDCSIGPYCLVGPEVKLARGVELKSHVAVTGDTSVGEATRIWPFASIGHQPQDLKFHGEKTKLVIGARNMIREHATMNPGTEGGGGVTRIGDGSLFMMSSHVGHDCQVGSGVVISNHCSLAGHVIMGDNVVMGGLSGVHQHCRVGRGVMIGGMTGVVADVIPYATVTGARGGLSGLNLVGLKRRNVDKQLIQSLRGAYRELFDGSAPLLERAKQIGEVYADNELVVEIVEFMFADSSRSFLTPQD